MSDTATQVKRTQAPRNVDYTLQVVDDLPEPIVQRRSPLEDAIDQVKANESFHGKWVRIGSYDNATASGAAANVLRQRHGGNESVEGFTIQSKRYNEDVKQEDGSTTQVPKTGLFVRFRPDAVVPGAREAWTKHETERLAQIEANRKEREAEAAKNGGQKAETPKGQAPQGQTQKSAASQK